MAGERYFKSGTSNRHLRVNLMSLQLEEQTIRAMVEIYCQAHHEPASGRLCEQCQELFEYAQARLGKCPFAAEKPVCAKCPIHCYRPAMRNQIRDVMRFAGPRMALRHPVLALAHLIQKRRPAPARPGRPTSAADETGQASTEMCAPCELIPQNVPSQSPHLPQDT